MLATRLAGIVFVLRELELCWFLKELELGLFLESLNCVYS